VGSFLRLRCLESGEYVAPRTPLEEALASIWSEVLRVDRVGIDDDFLILGVILLWRRGLSRGCGMYLR